MKTRTTFILFLTAILTLAAGSAFGKYSGGSGTAGTPYKIATKADLLALAANTDDYGKCFILTADINMAGQVFTTAIIAADNSFSFTGTFDGNGHKITNFTINGGSFVGLFGYIDSGGTVKNLGLENCSVSGDPDSKRSAVWWETMTAVSAIAIRHARSVVVPVLMMSAVWWDITRATAISATAIRRVRLAVILILKSAAWWDTMMELSAIAIRRVRSAVVLILVMVMWAVWWETTTGGSVSNCYSTGAVSGGDDSVWLGGLVGYNVGHYQQLLFDGCGQWF